MSLFGFWLYKLMGSCVGIWFVMVSGNWCVMFCFKDGDVEVVNYEDYY